VRLITINIFNRSAALILLFAIFASRLRTVGAVDETRVVLADSPEVGTRYINASFIDVSLH